MRRVLLPCAALGALAACGQRYDMGTVLSELQQPEPVSAGQAGAAGGGDHSTDAIATRLVTTDADADAWIDDPSGCSNAQVGLGDVDGDGFDDWMASHGLTFNVCHGGPRPVDGVIAAGANPRTRLTWPSTLERASRYGSAAGDVDGDGHDDVLFGMQLGEGTDPAVTARGFLWYGAAERSAGAAALDAVAVAIDAEHLRTAAGRPGASNRGMTLVGLGDLDGDGYADFAASTSAGYDADENLEVVTYLVYGRPERWDRDGSTLFADALFVSPAGAPARPTVNPVGDVNGDGYSDFIATAGGEAYLLQGAAQRFQGTFSLSSAGSALEGFSRLGLGLGSRGVVFAEALGDLDSDGYADFTVGAYEDTRSPGVADVAYSIFYGSEAIGDQPLRRSDANATIVAPTGRAFLQSLGDWDANGTADLGLTIEVQAGEAIDFRSPTHPSLPLFNEYHAIAGTSARFAGRYTAPAYRPDLPRPKVDENFQLLEPPAQNLFTPRPIGDIDGDGRDDMAFTITYGPDESGALPGSRSWFKYGGPLASDEPIIH